MIKRLHIILVKDAIVVVHHAAQSVEQMRRDLENLRNMTRQAADSGAKVHGLTRGELQRLTWRMERELNQRLAELN